MSNFNQAIVTFAGQSRNSRVWASNSSGQRLPNARGECWDLAYEALRSAGATTPTTQLYVWGQVGSLASAQPGDILQFTNFKIEIWVTEFDNRGNIVSSTTSPATEERGLPHHTAILRSRNAQTGEAEIYEQNWGNPNVALNTTTLEAKTSTRVLPGGNREETRVVVKRGSIRVYRAQ